MEKDIIGEIVFFSNGNVAAFDKEGNQLPSFQLKNLYELYWEFLEGHGIDPVGITYNTIINGREVIMKPFKTEDGTWSYRSEDV